MDSDTNVLVANHSRFSLFKSKDSSYVIYKRTITESNLKTLFLFDVQLIVHREKKNLIIKPTRYTNFSNLFLE